MHMTARYLILYFRFDGVHMTNLNQQPREEKQNSNDEYLNIILLFSHVDFEFGATRVSIHRFLSFYFHFRAAFSPTEIDARDDKCTESIALPAPMINTLSSCLRAFLSPEKKSLCLF